MVWTELHGRLCAGAFERVLGRAEPGAMAFVRCLSPDIVERLASDVTFSPGGWQVFRVADSEDLETRTITADRAVELREAKGSSVLLVVDTRRAGAGMDGIYSAAQEVQESNLFSHALRLAGSELGRVLTREARERAQQALKRARRFGRRLSISYWAEFDFLVRVAATRRDPGEILFMLGLWPIKSNPPTEWVGALDQSRLFVDRLLGTPAAGLTPAQRVESLKLLAPSDEQRADLERFVRSAATKPVLVGLEELADKEHLWINALRTEAAAQVIQSIELVPWRTNAGRVAKWSGLVEKEDADQPPALILKSDAERRGDYSKLEVRWKAQPDNLEKGAVTYRIAILTEMDEEIAVREVSHAGKKDEKCCFANDDFSMLKDDDVVYAKVVVSVIGNEAVEHQETEEFAIRFGLVPDQPQGGVGKEVRTFSEGLIELANRDAVSELSSAPSLLKEDFKGFVLLRTKDSRKSFRVFRPALIREVEQQWVAQQGTIGRWCVQVRASGERAGNPEFVSFAPDLASTDTQLAWDRAANANRRMAEHFATSGGGVGQVYDETSKTFETVVKEYLLAWAALLEEGDPLLALAHTVEVQTLSGRTVGLIVLPSHPLRVAWHVAYDSLGAAQKLIHIFGEGAAIV